MTELLFGVYVVFVVVVVLAVAGRRVGPRAFAGLALAVGGWLAYVGLMSYFGIVGNPTLRPPGAAYILLPLVFFVPFLARSRAGQRAALAVPAALMIGLQAYRVGVELLLHRLYLDGLVPKMMTYEGGNIDIAIGVSAPLVAWLATQGRTGRRWALAWNVVGLGSLANVAVRAVGTSPEALHFLASEVPNRAVGIFPYTYLAGLFAPLAVIGHVLTIRSLRHQLRRSADAAQAAEWNRVAGESPS